MFSLSNFGVELRIIFLRIDFGEDILMILGDAPRGEATRDVDTRGEFGRDAGRATAAPREIIEPKPGGAHALAGNFKLLGKNFKLLGASIGVFDACTSLIRSNGTSTESLHPMNCRVAVLLSTANTFANRQVAPTLYCACTCCPILNFGSVEFDISTFLLARGCNFWQVLSVHKIPNSHSCLRPGGCA